MKYIRQFIIIILISFIGEVLNYLLPLPIPASIYGLVLMLLGLVRGLIPLAAGQGYGIFFGGNHAADVYSGGGRSFGILAGAQADVRTDRRDHGSVDGDGHGGGRAFDAACDSSCT